MTFEKADKADSDTNSASESKSGGEETTVEIDGEEMPLIDAIQANREMLNNPANNGLLPLSKLPDIEERLTNLERDMPDPQQVNDLSAHVDRMSEQIQELRVTLEELAEAEGHAVAWDSFAESDSGGSSDTPAPGEN